MSPRLARPNDATLSVTRAARVLGVHPNTVRAWSDAGRIRFFRINDRGDRRYRLGDLHRFMAAGRSGTAPAPRAAASWGRDAAVPGGAMVVGSATRRVASWAAQLRSIQHLGARLNRLTGAQEIGRAIVGEIRLLIEHDAVRVYRLEGDELVPVALEGRVEEYFGETCAELRMPLGQGITGWVAAHKLAQYLPDCASDPRAQVVPGSSPGLAESMLLAPMLFDDAVLGVLVLTKLGIDQFTEDDLRLLEIYASFAAQAFSNAEVTERLEAKSAALERQLKSQHDLLSITESILTTLDSRRVLEQVADRLGELVGYENLVIEVVDPVNGELRPLTARGPRAAWLLKSDRGGEADVAVWVTEHRQAVLVSGERAGPEEGRSGARHPSGSLIAVPIRGRSGPRGVLVLQRGGADNRYTEAEFELVQLFAAQVSIALQNAEIYQAVEIRAASDDLTGLFNHGTFGARLEAHVATRAPFSLIMLDLDEFKNVNDELGHQAGDRLLAEIARALEAASREGDEIFRYGGEEFTIILPNADADGALRMANRVLATVCALGVADGRWYRRGVSISASLGVASYPADGRTAAEILLAADRACQVSKRNGRARISTAVDGLALAREFTLKEPTPVDRPRATSGA